MGFVNIDMHGRRHDRLGVKAIQRTAGKQTRLQAAQSKRDRRRAKRAAGPSVIVLHKMPTGGVAADDPDGAYVWGGNEDVQGKYQIIVVGAPVAEVDAYCAGLSRWQGKEFRVCDERPLDRPDEDPNPNRQFLSIILEPVT